MFFLKTPPLLKMPSCAAEIRITIEYKFMYNPNGIFKFHYFIDSPSLFPVRLASG